MTQQERETIFNCIVITKCGASPELLNLNDNDLLNELVNSCQALHEDFWQIIDQLNTSKSRNNELINNY